MSVTQKPRSHLIKAAFEGRGVGVGSEAWVGCLGNAGQAGAARGAARAPRPEWEGHAGEEEGNKQNFSSQQLP